MALCCEVELGAQHASTPISPGPLHYLSIPDVPLCLADAAQAIIEGYVPDHLEDAICFHNLCHTCKMIHQIHIQACR